MGDNDDYVWADELPCYFEIPIRSSAIELFVVINFGYVYPVSCVAL